MNDRELRSITANMKSIDVKLVTAAALGPLGLPAPLMMKAIRARTVEEYDLRFRAECGDIEAMLELSRRAEVAAREKAERAALRAERRRWRAAYQWAKWGE